MSTFKWPRAALQVNATNMIIAQLKPAGSNPTKYDFIFIFIFVK